MDAAGDHPVPDGGRVVLGEGDRPQGGLHPDDLGFRGLGGQRLAVNVLDAIHGA